MNVMRIGYGMGKEEFQRLMFQAKIKDNNNNIQREPINQKDIDHLKKILKAPDVLIFLKLI
jgi:hypothetical protein